MVIKQIRVFTTETEDPWPLLNCMRQARWVKEAKLSPNADVDVVLVESIDGDWAKLHRHTVDALFAETTTGDGAYMTAEEASEPLAFLFAFLDDQGKVVAI